MNSQGETVLVAAAMRGVRQLTGALADDDGGRCAQGVLAEAAGVLHLLRGPQTALLETTPSVDILRGHAWHRLEEMYGLSQGRSRCEHRCYGWLDPRYTELDLLAHLNDIHRCDFFEIARKLARPEAD